MSPKNTHVHVTTDSYGCTFSRWRNSRTHGRLSRIEPSIRAFSRIAGTSTGGSDLFTSHIDLVVPSWVPGPGAGGRAPAPGETNKYLDHCKATSFTHSLMKSGYNHFWRLCPKMQNNVNDLLSRVKEYSYYILCISSAQFFAKEKLQESFHTDMEWNREMSILNTRLCTAVLRQRLWRRP